MALRVRNLALGAPKKTPAISTSSEGPIGKAIRNKHLRSREILTFKPFKGLGKNLPTVAEAKAWKLRSDQLYAVEWAWVMVEGRKAIEKNPHWLGGHLAQITMLGG